MTDLLGLTPLGLLFKARNQAIDAVFYDTSALTFQEWIALNPLTDKKGKIIVVPPSNSRGQAIRHYFSVEEFLASDDSDRVFAVAVAGVGSSVIGTAALARNVADAYQGDVAGVVSGYGVSDVALEALGGWYFYGKIDQLRFELSSSLDDLSALISQSFAKGTDIRKTLNQAFNLPLDDSLPPNPDVMSLYSILLRKYLQPNSNLRLLVGHSKGNLLIGDVLNHLSFALQNVDQEREKAFQDLKAFQNLAVVTLGGVVDIPKDLIPEANQYQFLGTLDVLGRINSRSILGDIAPRERIPGTWHSLNSKLLGHMDAINLLQTQVKLPPPLESDDGHLALKRRELVAAAFGARSSKAGTLSALVSSK